MCVCVCVCVCEIWYIALKQFDCRVTSLASQAKSEMDEDGFFEGDICGDVGFVPGNMVEEITSPEELALVPELLAAQAERRKEQSKGRGRERREVGGNSRRRGGRGRAWVGLKCETSGGVRRASTFVSSLVEGSPAYLDRFKAIPIPQLSQLCTG